MPKSTYESLSGTVLDFKKSHKIGRFDPTAPEKEAQKVRAMWKEIEEKGKPSISTTDLLLCAVRKLLALQGLRLLVAMHAYDNIQGHLLPVSLFSLLSVF